MIIKKDFVPRNRFGKYISAFHQLDHQIAIFYFLCKYFPVQIVQNVLMWLDVMATYRLRCDGKLGALFKFTACSDVVRVQEVCLDPETGKILRDGDVRAEVTNTLCPNATYYNTPKGYKACMVEKELINSRCDVIYAGKSCFFGQAQCFDHAGYDRPYGVVKHIVSAIILNICGYKDKNSPIWLATGGSNFTDCDLSNIDILKFFQYGKKMILFPGAGLYDKSKEIEQLIRSKGIDVRISHFMENAKYEGKQSGDDISDYIISEIKRGIPYKEAYEEALDRYSLSLDWFSEMVENNGSLK